MASIPSHPELLNRLRSGGEALPTAGEKRVDKVGPTSRAGWLLLTVAIVWCYWWPMSGLVARWWSDPDYLHGFLVPPFAAYLLWARREMVRGVPAKGSWWGTVLLGLCAAAQFVAAYYYFELLEAASLCLCVAGLMLFIGGWQYLRWSWPSAAFLAFMVPLPGFLANLLSHPLQRVATIASTYIVQTAGIPAVAEGNTILLCEGRIGVAEACSGLRNMMLFIVVCAGMACLVRRTALEKAIVVLSAVPIALAANVVRITLTALLHALSRHDWATTTYHDLAAWLMMPLAVAFLWIELGLLTRVFVSIPTDDPTADL